MEHLETWSKGETALYDGTVVPNTLIGVFHDISLAVEVSSDMIFIKNDVTESMWQNGKILPNENTKDRITGIKM